MVYTSFNGPRRITKARYLRKTQTQAEKLLWEELRNRKLSGFKFRRQQILNEMIVDFFCAEKKLIIELDGPYHNDPLQRIKDHNRDQELISLGFKVYRITNNQIFQTLEQTLKEIKALLNSPTP